MAAQCAVSQSPWQTMAELAMLVVSSRHAPEDGRISDHLALAPSWQAQLQEVALKEDTVRLEVSVSPLRSTIVPYITCQLHSGISEGCTSSVFNAQGCDTSSSVTEVTRPARLPAGVWTWKPILMERWSLSVKKKSSIQGERPVTVALLSQAVRSFLMFSQLQSWLSLTEHQWPVHIHYRLLSAGFNHPEHVLNFEGGASSCHNFPLGNADGCHALCLSVTARQRCHEIPFLTPELAASVEARRQQLLPAVLTEQKEPKVISGRRPKRRRQPKEKGTSKCAEKLEEAKLPDVSQRTGPGWESDSDGMEDSVKDSESPFRKRVTSPAINVPHRPSSSSSREAPSESGFSSPSPLLPLTLVSADTIFDNTAVMRPLRQLSIPNSTIHTATPICSPVEDGMRPRPKEFRRSVSGPCQSLPPLLGSYEESVLNGRLTPVDTLPGFTMELSSCSSDGHCSPHVTLPVHTQFFESRSGTPSPYLGISTPPDSYLVPKKGTIQLVLFRPSGSIVHVFVVKYDLTHLSDDKSFIRQRTVMDNGGKVSTLQYAAHLSVRPNGTRLQLYKDIRVVFPPFSPDVCNDGLGKRSLMTQTVGPHITMATEHAVLQRRAMPLIKQMLPLPTSAPCSIAQ